MANGIEELQAEHEKAQQRREAATAQQQQATARLEELTGKIADSPVSAWRKLIREFVEVRALAELADTVGRILARREQAALVAIHEAKVSELQAVAQEAFQARKAAKVAADELDKRFLRFTNGGDREYRELEGEARENYRIALHRDRAEARARAQITHEANNAASDKAREAEEALAEIVAAAPE